MNTKKIFVFYFISFSTFILTTFIYVPRPRLNQFLLNFEKNDQIYIKEVFLKNDNLSNKTQRRINVGNSYFMVVDDMSLYITYLAFWDKKNFNLSYYSKYLPQLIIDTNEIKEVNKDNYGVKNTTSVTKYQACLFNDSESYFLYKSKNDEIVIRYNNFNHWLRVMKKEILGLFSDSEQKKYDCLLITTSDVSVFEDKKKNIIKLISNNYFFEEN